MNYDVTVSALVGAENKLRPAVLCDGETIRVIVDDAPEGAILFAENESTRRSIRIKDGAAELPPEFSRTSRLVLTIGVFADGACVQELPLPPLLVVKADGATALRDWVQGVEQRLEDIEAAVFGQKFSFLD